MASSALWIIGIIVGFFVLVGFFSMIFTSDGVDTDALLGMAVMAAIGLAVWAPIGLIVLIVRAAKKSRQRPRVNAPARDAYVRAHGSYSETRVIKPPSKIYKPYAWISFGIYSSACAGFFISVNIEDIGLLTSDMWGLLITVSLFACIIFGIIALTKRSKHKPKDRPKSKFNIWLLLTLPVPFIGMLVGMILGMVADLASSLQHTMAAVFCVIATCLCVWASLANKTYSSLSKHLTCWIAVTWFLLALLLPML